PTHIPGKFTRVGVGNTPPPIGLLKMAEKLRFRSVFAKASARVAKAGLQAQTWNAAMVASTGSPGIMRPPPLKRPGDEMSVVSPSCIKLSESVVRAGPA